MFRGVYGGQVVSNGFFRSFYEDQGANLYLFSVQGLRLFRGGRTRLFQEVCIGHLSHFLVGFLFRFPSKGQRFLAVLFWYVNVSASSVLFRVQWSGRRERLSFTRRLLRPVFLGSFLGGYN